MQGCEDETDSIFARIFFQVYMFRFTLAKDVKFVVTEKHEFDNGEESKIE